MGIEHNLMAMEVSSILLGELRSNQAKDWATPSFTEKSILWQGIADWPRPDIAFEDPDTGATLALEFKPPNCVKREYVTGLGQMLTYLADFEFSGLVLPEKSSDGFEIAAYISDAVKRDLDKLPGLPPEKWSILKVRISAIYGLKGALNGTEEIYTGADHRDAAGDRGSAGTGREGWRDMPFTRDIGAELLSLAA